MNSRSFWDTQLKICRWVEDSIGQVVEGLTILDQTWGIGSKGLIGPNK